MRLTTCTSYTFLCLFFFTCPHPYILQDAVVSKAQRCDFNFFPGVSFKLHSTKQARLFSSKELTGHCLFTAYYIKYFSIRQPLVWINKCKRLRTPNNPFLSLSNITHVFQNLLLQIWKDKPSAASTSNLFTASCLGFSSLSKWINLCYDLLL